MIYRAADQFSKVLNKLLISISSGINNFDTRQSRTFGYARSLMAVAQLSLLVFTSTAYYFVPVAGLSAEPSCSEYNGWTAYCLAPTDKLSWVSWGLAVGLLIVISGVAPRITSFIHLWITYSISTAISLPDGGEAAAQVLSVFLVVIALADNRKNHWLIVEPSTPLSPLSPLAWAGWLGLRLQVFWIYVTASVAKFGVEEWSDGSSIYYITRQVFFGIDGPLRESVLWLTSQPLLALTMAWGSMILELAIAILVLLPFKQRKIALILTILFHSGIILMIGLWSFGTIMVSCVLATLVSDKARQNIRNTNINYTSENIEVKL